ncbi:SDR family NAD(P)-dependent oxidoreductase [Catenulispora rubra]|uniref:SDR family NAD(P)-dependent oxidoreductase n=1 Tax=Catenulispora rubra TaxID=280293 RepID=UPI001892229B|nr:SDR family NAD(P)-dependent oxidoreductase [Catenulispora rubra]
MSKNSTSSRTVLVTGADAGLGLEIARQLAAQRAHVIVHARTPELGEQAVRTLVADGAQAGRLSLVTADFADLAQVTAMARQVAADHRKLDLLVNNAAMFGTQTRTLTADAHESTFQVNYLAPYLLTRLLWPMLTAEPGSRVVNVSSALHRGGRLHWGDVDSAKRYSAVAAYAQSKLALNLFTKAVAVRGGTGLIAASVHPGILATDMVRNYTRQLGRPVSEGAAAVLHLANAHVEDGGYYEGVAASVPNLLMNDPSSVDRLWKLSARLVGLAA